MNLPTYTIVASVVILVFATIIHRFVVWSARRLSRDLNKSVHRRQYINRFAGYILYTIAALLIGLIWFIREENFSVVLGGGVAIIGAALFANWSLLSNVTASFILYFSFPIKIGDRVRIHDKDLPVTATIVDIKAFYTMLKTVEGEQILYPNNMLLQKGISILGNKQESVFDMHGETDRTA